MSKSFNCSLCPKSFASGKGLKIHLTRHHNLKHNHDDKTIHELKSEIESSVKKYTKKYACNKCSLRFESIKEYKVHYKTHSIDPMLETYKSSDVAVLKSYKCPNCSTSFSDYEKYRCHLSSHFDFCDYSCVYCLKSFGSESLLNSHTKKDHSVKLYSCSICDEKFYKHIALQHHRSTHTFMPPYNCSSCEMPCITINDRLRHLRNHYYKCAACNTPVKYKDYFLHVAKAHGKDFDASIPDSSSEEEMSDNEEGASKNPTKKSKLEKKNGFSSPKQTSSICFICDKKIVARHLDFHLKSHNVHKCPTCLKYFPSESQLKNHEWKHVKAPSASLPISAPVQIGSATRSESHSFSPTIELVNNNSFINAGTNMTNVFKSDCQSFKIDAVYSNKDLPSDSDSEASSDIISWYIDLKEKCRKLGYPISEELCHSIEEIIKELSSELKNSYDLPPHKRNTYERIVKGLKNILIKNVMEM